MLASCYLNLSGHVSVKFVSKLKQLFPEKFHDLSQSGLTIVEDLESLKAIINTFIKTTFPGI